MKSDEEIARDNVEAVLRKLEKLAPVAIWRGSWASHTPKAGKQIITIYQMDPDGEQVGPEIATGESLLECLSPAVCGLVALSEENGK